VTPLKKAQRFLKAQGVNFEFIDFRDQPIDEKTLQSFVDALGWDQLINKRSTTYRNLTDKEKKDITLELTLKKTNPYQATCFSNNCRYKGWV